MTELERLREALKWYADADNYRRIQYPDGDENAYRRQQAVAFVEMDKGQRARLALEGKDMPVDPYTVQATGRVAQIPESGPFGPTKF